MNSNVVHVNFKARRPKTPLEEFWSKCQWGLCMDDYAELHQAIIDPVIYNQADSEIRDLAEEFFRLDAAATQDK